MTHSFPPSSFFRAVLLAAASLGAPAMAADTAQLPAIRVTADDAAADDGRLHAIGAVPPPATLDHTVTQSVSVVDRQDLDRLSAISTLELLGRIPNATINLGGGIGGTLFLRGMDTLDMRVPVFIDGDRFRGRNKLQFMLISPTELEAVEVVRGPDSARFGSDGLGGLINFVTKRAHGNLEHGFALGGGEVSATWQSNGNGMQPTWRWRRPAMASICASMPPGGAPATSAAPLARCPTAIFAARAGALCWATCRTRANVLRSAAASRM